MFTIDDEAVRRNKALVVPAYLVEWVDGRGRVVRTQVSSEYPMTELYRGKETQRMAAKVLGHTYADALAALTRMLERVNPELAKNLKRGMA